MGFAEKKVELLKIVADADEETTGRLIEFANQIRNSSNYSDEELQKFHATRKKYQNSSEPTISMEDAHAYIRSLKQK